MSIDLKFVELTADVLEIFFILSIIYTYIYVYLARFTLINCGSCDFVRLTVCGHIIYISLG